MSRQHTSVRAYGVLIHEQRIALVRSSNPRHNPALWWLPGGGIKFGEAPEDTLIREFKEETGLEVASPFLLGVTSDVRNRDNGDQSPHRANPLHRATRRWRTASRDPRHHGPRRVVRSRRHRHSNVADYAREAIASS